MSKKSRRLGWMFLAAILLAFPIFAMVIRIESFKGNLSYAENMARFLGHFPQFLQNKTSVTWVALMLNITANALTIGTAIGKRTKSNWLSVALLIIGVFVMIWLGITLL